MERHQPIDLPHDLITHNILTRLPIKPLIRFKSVSKQWYSTISSPHFANTHFKFPRPSSTTESLIIQSNNKFRFLSYNNNDQNTQVAQILEENIDVGSEKLVLVGSCNGLVCLGSTSGRLFIIWNPITREFHKYLDSQILDDVSKIFTVTWGFGYVSAIDDYKIVRIFKKVFPWNLYRVHVFSIKLNKWRRIDEETGHDFSYLKLTYQLRKPGVVVNETLYWMGVVLYKIISFDLALERFNTFLDLDVGSPILLSNPDKERYIDCFVFVLTGYLSIYGSLYSSGGVITILNHRREIGEVFIPNSLAGRNCDSLIGFSNSYKFFKLNGAELAIIDPCSTPKRYTPLITFEETSETEICSYSPTLISPYRVTPTTAPTGATI